MSGGLADRIVGAESGGNATAKNPRSSATGAGQFIEGTWLDMIGRYRPDLAGLGREQVLGLRNDPSLSRQMTQAYADENGQKLQAAGVPVNDGSKYLAHFAGPQGAINTLSADPSTPVSQILDAKQVAANPFVRPMTAGQLVDWASRKVGGSAPTMTMPAEGGPAASGKLGLSGVEAVPYGYSLAAPAAKPTSDGAKDDGPDVASILKLMAGDNGLAALAQQTGSAPAAVPSAPPMVPLQRRAVPFDRDAFLALLTRPPAR